MKKAILIFSHLIFFLLCSCGGDSGGETDDVIGDDGPMTEGVPGVANLVFPNNNEECAEGVVLNAAESRITFQWSASENTDSYDLSITYLNTGTNTITASTTNQADVTLERGQPYSWFVVSKSNSVNETATSEIWQFYNEGPGIENYAPFPAQAVSPVRGSTISSVATITLQWTGSDVDNDITGYEVFFGTNANSDSSLGTTTQNSVNVSVTGGQTYYWRIATFDSKGNSSQSEIFVFNVD